MRRNSHGSVQQTWSRASRKPLGKNQNVWSRTHQFQDARPLLDAKKSGEVKAIILPTNVTRSTIERRLAKLLKQLVLNPKEEKARYHPSNLKVDVNSLEKCLKAYDMRIEGKTNVEIGAMFLFEDAQKVLKDADLKNKCNVGAYRLIKKAEANIKAVEKGMFGVGH